MANNLCDFVLLFVSFWCMSDVITALQIQRLQSFTSIKYFRVQRLTVIHQILSSLHKGRKGPCNVIYLQTSSIRGRGGAVSVTKEKKKAQCVPDKHFFSDAFDELFLIKSLFRILKSYLPKHFNRKLYVFEIIICCLYRSNYLMCVSMFI